MNIILLYLKKCSIIIYIFRDSTKLQYYKTFGPYISSCTIDSDILIKTAALNVIQININNIAQRNTPLDLYKSICSLSLRYFSNNNLKVYEKSLLFFKSILKFDGNPFIRKNLNDNDILKGIKIILHVLFLKCADTNHDASKLTIDFIMNLSKYDFIGIDHIIIIANEIIQQPINKLHYKELLGRLLIYELLLKDINNSDQKLEMLDLIYYCIGYKDMEVRQKAIQLLMILYKTLGDKALTGLSKLSLPSQEVYLI